MTKSSCWAWNKVRFKLEIKNEELGSLWNLFQMDTDRSSFTWSLWTATGWPSLYVPHQRTGLRWESLGEILWAAMNAGSDYITAICHLGLKSRNINNLT